MLSPDEMVQVASRLFNHGLHAVYGGLGGVLSFLFSNLINETPMSFIKFITYLFAGASVGAWAGDFLPTGMTGRDALIGISGFLSFYFLSFILSQAQKIFEKVFKV